MLQLICSLTQAPQPGDLYGRCSKTRNKEPGWNCFFCLYYYYYYYYYDYYYLILLIYCICMFVLYDLGMFLYRPGKVNTSTSTEDSNSSDKSQLYIIWQRIREIDVLDELPVTEDAHSLGFVKINPIAKQLTGAAGGDGGTGRWSEELQQELTLQLRRAVLKYNVSTTSAVASTDIAATITATTIPTAEPSKSPSSYFDNALQAQLRTQCLDPVTLLALEGLVLTESMQDIMGYTTARVPGCEDYLSTSGRFYRPVTNTVVPNKTHIATAGKTKKPILEEGEELEDGEEEEVSTTEVEADTTAEVQQMQLTGVNTKTYFTEEHNNNSHNNDNNNSSSSSSSSSDDEFCLAAVMANNLRKRKAQVAALASNEDTAELVVEENVLLRGIPINYNNNSSSSSGSAKKRKLTDSESPEEVVTLKSAPPESISTVLTHSNVKQTTQKLPRIPSIPPPPPPPSFPPPQQTKDTTISTDTVSTIITTTTYTPFILPAHSITTPLAVCALDCEMCTTSAGLELTRLTLICPINGVIYDTLVR